MKIYFEYIILACFFLINFRVYYNRFNGWELFTIILGIIILLFNSPDAQNYFVVLSLLFCPITTISILELFTCLTEHVVSILFETIISHYLHLINIFLYIFIFFVLQLISLNYCNKNIRRKNFHFLAMLVYKNSNQLTEKLSVLALLFSVITIRLNLIPRFCHGFLRKENLKKDEFSLFILLICIITPSYILKQKEYLKLLISICIMDSAASIVGIAFKMRRKSWIGFFSGQIFSYAFEFYLINEVDVFYHTIIGFGELLSVSNDNLCISLLACVYLILKRQILNN